MKDNEQLLNNKRKSCFRQFDNSRNLLFVLIRSSSSISENYRRRTSSFIACSTGFKFEVMIDTLHSLFFKNQILLQFRHSLFWLWRKGLYFITTHTSNGFWIMAVHWKWHQWNILDSYSISFAYCSHFFTGLVSTRTLTAKCLLPAELSLGYEH